MFDDLQNQSDQKNKPPLEPQAPTAPKEDISQRIKGLEEQGRKQGKRKTIYSAIGIAVILLFAGGIITAGYYFWPEITAGIDKLTGKSAEQIEINNSANNNENQPNETAGNTEDSTEDSDEPLIINEEWKNCSEDSDCVEIHADCCECNNGGTQIAINNQYLEEWKNAIKTKCQDMACATVYNCKEGKAICENGKCAFKEDMETVSASSTEENMNLDISGNLDSDNDGLTDVDETKYGTDANNPDSDGDGYLDGDEVQNGYNPMGEGKLQ
jgi:hypothetical protein